MGRRRVAKRRGRPTLLTRAATERACAALRKGSTWAGAAYAAGVHPSTLERWRARGEADPSGAYGELAWSVAQAREEWVMERLRAIEAAAAIPNKRTGCFDWRADAWLLEKIEPARFGRVKVVEPRAPPVGQSPEPLNLGGLVDS